MNQRLSKSSNEGAGDILSDDKVAKTRVVKNESSKPKARPAQIANFRSLKKYMSIVATHDLRRPNMFAACVKASVCKCYEFNLAVPQIAKTGNAFFAISSLRGICEDLIVLHYIASLPAPDREALVQSLSSAELSTRIKLQDDFFTSFRPQQPVLRMQDATKAIDASEAKARAIWNKHGWPNLSRGSIPQVQQIAEKQGEHQLAILYDYLYRLTSGGVHFNVQSLLRSGWGPLPNLAFSARHFHRYFAEYCSLYGAFMFCLYFEFFQGLLRAGKKQRDCIDKIRQEVLFTPRWPEMVTYEEMNLKPPEGGQSTRMIMSAFQAVTRKRLISKSVNYKDRQSGESKLMDGLFKVLAADAGIKPKKNPSVVLGDLIPSGQAPSELDATALPD